MIIFAKSNIDMTIKKWPIEDVVLFQIEKTNKSVKQYSQREFDQRGMGITVDQWVLLKIIHEGEDLSQQDIAQRSRRDPASITRTLDILGKEGLAGREAALHDRRQRVIRLTDKGKSFVEEHMDFIQAQRKLSTKGFTKAEKTLLVDMLKRIQQNMS